MEVAIEELKNTIREAEEYNARPESYIEDLRSHVVALAEDIGLMERRKPADTEQEKLSQALATKARRLKRTLERKINELAREMASRRTEIETTPEDGGNAKIKFSNLSMPTFDGNAASYQEFVDVFDKIIKKEKGMTELKKWLLLKQNVSGKAAEMIAYLPLAEESYETAMKLYRDTFAGKRRAITSLTQQLEAMPTASMDTWSLRLTHSRIEGILITLEKRGEKPKENHFLVSLVMSKYPEEIRLKVVSDEDMSLESFQKEVGRLIRIREGILTRTVKAPTEVVSSRTESQRTTFGGRKTNGQNSGPTRVDKMGNEGSNTQTGSEQSSARKQQNREGESAARDGYRGKRRFSSRNPLCIFCEKSHWSDECPEFATVAARKNKLVDKCHICLKKKHTGVACIRQKRCVHCQENSHHRSLCPKKFNEPTKGGATGSGSEFVAFSASDGGFFTLLLVVSGENSRKKKVRAVIDTAGGRTLITEELAKSLGAFKRDETTIIKGVGREPPALECMGKSVVKLHPPRDAPIEIHAQVVDYVTDDLPAPDIKTFRANHPECRDLLIPETGSGQKIDLLLGRDSLFDILTLENSMRIGADVQLLSTVFGWLILERDSKEMAEKRKRIESNCLLLRTEDAIKRLWELDCVGLKELEAADVEMETRALSQFYENIRYKEGRYEVAWPYIETEPKLNNNFGLALGRLRSLYKKLAANGALLAAYDQLIRTQICEGITEPVEGETRRDGAMIRYIPHQAVVRPNKSTPVRIVYDASAKSGPNDKSLNERMAKGLNWVPDLSSALLRFRRNKVAVTADIERAFHQISIREQDRDAVRFLWVKRLHEPPENENIWVLRFKRMAFGVVASPFLLSATIKYHLRRNSYKFAELIEEEMYADNLVISVPQEIPLNEFYEATKTIFKDMSMNLTKWATNNKTLRNIIRKEDQVEENEQNVLGLRWLMNEDELSLKLPAESYTSEGIVTKRKALKELASVFDPLGWTAPVTLLAKQYIRELWNQKCAWDDKLKSELVEKWREIAVAIREVDKVVLPRAFFEKDLKEMKEVTMHLFVDASKLAYAAVIYLRTVDKEKAKLVFVAAKNRLAPKKLMTIPRLELLALFMGSKYADFVRSSLKMEQEVPLITWSDSKCVLAWARTNKILPTTIEKQIRQIKATKKQRLAYVPSQMNPADVASRGATVQQLLEQNWWRGILIWNSYIALIALYDHHQA